MSRSWLRSSEGLRALLVAVLFVALMLGVALPSLGKAAAADRVTTMAGEMELGAVIPMGQGTARSWLRFDAARKPAAVGVTFTEAALGGLAADATPGLIWMQEFILPLPEHESLPFDHIGLNWNPRGHDPAGVYTVPHFDVHFYTVSEETRRAISARGGDLDRIRQAPAAGFLPAHWIFAPDSEEPGMGGHWVDPDAHELHGKPFDHCFIYGTYDGRVIFWEPMITKAFLESKATVSQALDLPERYPVAGYYPTHYDIRWDEKRREYTVSLEGLTHRGAR